MGDRKPKRTSSGNSDAHKSKVAKDLAARPVLRPATDIKPKGDPK